MKYPRTLHLPFSPGTTSDDRFVPTGYLEAFSKFPSVVITEKLDGENTCMNKYGTFSRSHTAPTVHPWAEPVIKKQKLIQKDLESMNIELFGEGMFGIHSIEYSKLESYFYLFAIRIDDTWLSWDEVKFHGELFDFPTVPIVNRIMSIVPPESGIVPLDVYTALKLPNESEDDMFKNWLKLNLQCTVDEFTDTPGYLGGFDPITGESACEGLVIRNSDEFKTNNGFLNTYPNEMDAVVKYVRKKHVKTDVHWTKTWRKAKLIDYSKFKWDEYQYLSL